MSIRIHQQQITPAGAAQAGTVRSAGSGSSAPGNRTSGSEDQIEVSATAEKIRDAISTQSPERTQRIADIGRLVAAGAYSLSSSELSHSIVQGALNAAGTVI